MEQPVKKTSANHTLETVKKVRGIVKSFYTSALEAKEQGRPVAYCMVSCGYDEILRTMDITPVWTENYAALCAAKRDAERFLSEAEANGYFMDICGYVRTGIGFDSLRHELGEMPPGAPDGGMAEPDLVLGSSFRCDPRFKWYQALGRYKEVPIYSHDTVTPPVDADLKEVAGYYIKYQTAQFQGLIDFLEEQLGRKFDYDKFCEIMRISLETMRMWQECYLLRKASPCPMPTQDHFSAMVPGYYILGTQEALDFYRELYAEVKQRADNKLGVVPEEKYRILWGAGLPPWHTLQVFSFFGSKGAVFCMDTEYRPWEPVDVPVKLEDDPVAYLAWRRFLRYTRFHERAMAGPQNIHVQEILELVKDYNIDGVVMHASRTCRASTIGQRFLADAVQEYAKIPVLQLTSDIIDVRDFSEAEWYPSIETFIEMVDVNKKSRTG
ncbi:2-hydroxyacyl-CoA dehydratase subunit D [Chloroflexota bacterium]